MKDISVVRYLRDDEVQEVESSPFIRMKILIFIKRVLLMLYLIFSLAIVNYGYQG